LFFFPFLSRRQNGEVRDMLKVPPPVPMVYTAVNK
jgi:hypothetical protein